MILSSALLMGPFIDTDLNCWNLSHSAASLILRTRLNLILLRLFYIIDYDLLATQIDHALVKVSENRKRRGHEAAYKQNRRDVERHYSRLRSEKPAITLPPLAAFRELPIIAMLQESPSTAQNSNISHTFQTTSWVQNRLNAELDSWVQNAKTELGTILGYPNWKTASTVVLHPCDRVTALFRCKNCPRLPLKYLNDGCLDFRGACAHECTRMSKVQKRHNKTWDPDKFEKDDKVGHLFSEENYKLIGL
jgi:hypothetical protein